MSGAIHGLSWFPNFPDKFVVWGQEISLFELRDKEHQEQPKGRFAHLPGSLLATETRYQYARCVQPSYHKDRPLLAVGLADGKVGLCNFCEIVDSNCEYTPRQQRMCTCLAWNELEPNVLAVGHDRYRADTCITIWDIERGLPKEATSFLGNSESAHSICWDKNSRLLIAGMSQKQIKLFDLRQSNATCQSVQTKTVHGLAVAPNGNCLCSFVDSLVMLWDLRMIERPLKQIQSTKNHLQLSWCPTRTCLLSSLQRESPYITLYDISIDAEQNREVNFFKKQIQPLPSKHHSSNVKNCISSLSWHSSDFERALLLLEAGTLLDYKLPLSILTSFSNQKKMPLLLRRPASAPNTPTHNSSVDLGAAFHFESLDMNNSDLVISSRQLALEDYGLKMDFRRFSDQRLSAYLKNVWYSLGNLYREERLQGLKSILNGNTQTTEALVATSRTKSQVLPWPDFIKNTNNLVCYRSEQRDMALKRCGWSFEQDLERFISSLCENKEFSRAAMICVFHLKVLAACDILTKAADQSAADANTYQIAAIALSSFNADNSTTVWSKQRNIVQKKLQDAHLRAIFSFLTVENENYDGVLHEEGVTLSDRVAFACKYLSDSKLSDYVKQQIQKCIETGDLFGLLLTGESIEGINILQAYMDATGDVQTVAMIAVNYFHHEHYADKRIKYWISSYMNCLNSWGLWEKRAELEIKMENIRPTARSTGRTAFLACNFCGKSVSSALQDDVRLRSASTNINKFSSCPNCRKPLPRCALCLLHMGTTINTNSPTDAGHESLGWQSKPFSKWFSWCQTCRHGGHTEHIIEWFKQYSECPVSSCTCKCYDLDATIPHNKRDLL